MESFQSYLVSTTLQGKLGDHGGETVYIALSNRFKRHQGIISLKLISNPSTLSLNYCPLVKQLLDFVVARKNSIYFMNVYKIHSP